MKKKEKNVIMFKLFDEIQFLDRRYGENEISFNIYLIIFRENIWRRNEQRIVRL